MFVFTVSDKLNQQVYVGSCRTDIESHWVLIMDQAQSGAEGTLFESIRHNSQDNFEVEEWAYAENSRELKPLLEEAREATGAQPIRQQAKLYKPNVKREDVSPDIRRLFEMVEADLESEAEDDVVPVDEQSSSSKQEPATTAPDSVEVAASDKVATGRTGSALKEKRIKEALEQERDQRESHRHNQSTVEANAMREVMLRIEQRRQSQRKTPLRKKPGSSLRQAVKQKATTTAAKTTKKPAAASAGKLAKGRTGSALKEKRIKEAIAQEKQAMDTAKNQQVSAQADEMASILANLDERGKAADSRRRKM